MFCWGPPPKRRTHGLSVNGLAMDAGVPWWHCHSLVSIGICGQGLASMDDGVWVQVDGECESDEVPLVLMGSTHLRTSANVAT